jgi:uncharacterized membrane protein YoaK (UPF0700 family)
MERLTYALYKGLQRPLVFKFLRGRFIYWGLGSIVAGIITGGIVSAFFSSLAGLVTLLCVSLPLLLHTISAQKKGLHRKRRDHGVFMIAPKQRLRRHGREKNI